MPLPLHHAWAATDPAYPDFAQALERLQACHLVCSRGVLSWSLAVGSFLYWFQKGSPPGWFLGPPNLAGLRRLAAVMVPGLLL